MAFISPLLARLFGKSEVLEEPEQKEETQAPPPEQPKPRPELHLPPEHPLNQLWNMYNWRSRASGPVLCMEAPEGREDMPEDEVKRELLRLQVLVNNTAKKRLELARPKQKEGEKPATPVLDAQTVVFTTKSGLSAWLLVYPPVGGGKELDQAALDEALDQAQVRFGLDQELLSGLPQNRDRYFHLYPVAWGEPPVHGTDGRVMELFPRTVEREFVVDDHNRVDYTTLSTFHNVDKDGVICRIVAPTEGVPGRSVQDEELPAKNGRAASVPKGRNTYLAEDGSALLASIAGQVEFSGRSFQVKPLLEIQGDVDFSTGNINFLGDVYIHGDICSGFTVRAMGNITVGGVVEACSVEAGGDLVVSRGVQGDNQAVLRVQRNVFAKYLENCCVYVKETLHTDCIINCDVYCDGLVEVRSGRMTIIGGSIRAAQEVSAGTIGSRTEARTDILLGGLPCGEFDHDLLVKEIQELTEEMERTERQPESPQKLGRIGKLRVKLIVNQKKLEQLEQEKDLLEEASGNSCVRRMQCDTVYPGTCLTIDGTSYQFDRQIYPCNATLMDGEIILL